MSSNADNSVYRTLVVHPATRGTTPFPKHPRHCHLTRSGSFDVGNGSAARKFCVGRLISGFGRAGGNCRGVPNFSDNSPTKILGAPVFCRSKVIGVANDVIVVKRRRWPESELFCPSIHGPQIATPPGLLVNFPSLAKYWATFVLRFRISKWLKD